MFINGESDDPSNILFNNSCEIIAVENNINVCISNSFVINAVNCTNLIVKSCINCIFKGCKNLIVEDCINCVFENINNDIIKRSIGKKEKLEAFMQSTEFEHIRKIYKDISNK